MSYATYSRDGVLIQSHTPGAYSAVRAQQEWLVRHEALCLLSAESAAQEAETHRTWYRVLSWYG